MVPTDFKAMLVTLPMRRTEKGMRVVVAMASDLPEQQMSLLRRFTGETLFEYLVPSMNSLETAYADAYALFQRGLIAPSHEPRVSVW